MELVFKVRGEQTDGTLTAFENLVAPGERPPLHAHANEDEAIYVLEGEVRFKLGDEILTGPAGSYVFVPRGTPHAWQTSATGWRGCSSISRPRDERFFDGFAALEAPGPTAFEEVGAEVGVDVVGLPLAQSDPL